MAAGGDHVDRVVVRASPQAADLHQQGAGRALVKRGQHGQGRAVPRGINAVVLEGSGEGAREGERGGAESDRVLIDHLRRDFVLVKIDVNRSKDPQMNVFTDGRQGHPTRMGIPALVLLDAAGEKLAEQDTGELENTDRSGYERAKLLALFTAWAPPPKTGPTTLGTR